MQQQQLHARLMKCLSCSHSHLPLPPPRPPPFYSLQRFASSQPKGTSVSSKAKLSATNFLFLINFKLQCFHLLAFRHHLEATTNAYRLVNSEGDRLSGLIVDVFGDLAVVASSAAWVETYKSKVKACISSIDEINHIHWRPSVEILKEEGMDAADLKELHPSTCPQRTKVIENGISYAISLEGQKTGFYADQRENRMFLSTISHGQRVLDVCCYSGGFALNAAKGGAMSITGVDTSLPALELARENIALNNLDPEKTSFLREDATVFMKGALSRNDSWDIVILDPPKLAPRRKVLQSASGMYRNLNSLAMKITGRGGLLMSCSCSGAMTQSGTFLRTLQGAASMAERKITVLRQSGAGCDHPIDPSYPEGAYLSNILLRVL
ncbi:hypothetical protein GOBAR_AA28905 [Gossypium barbadense]|uniref:S-adenosylmethionine-dependent methyltransferase domain-containing protein n=1 Tax=Gossypium barbadense TaxID=3634 RepID=A0A2P5WL24_GOSBA|nr:hypothetical protein GOBAR_AA28905 [Gossypium barbadense]